MNKITEERKNTLGMRGGQRVVWYGKAQNEEERSVKTELERKTGRVRKRQPCMLCREAYS